MPHKQDQDNTSVLPGHGATRRILELDGIRGLAVISILIFHMIRAGTIGTPPGSGWAYFAKATMHLWSGVDLFFVLSGFLICGILLKQKDSPNVLSVFYVRRACRILPAYAMLLAGHYALRPWYGDSLSWIFSQPEAIPDYSYFLFLQNVFMGLHGEFGGHFLGVTWSLAVEEQFYLVLPFFILYFSRKHSLSIIIGLLFLAPSLRMLDPGLSAYVNMPMRMDSLLVGAVIAYMYSSKSTWEKLQAHSATILAAAVAMSFAVVVAVYRELKLDQLGHLWFAILYGCIIVLALLYSGKPVALPLRNRGLRYCGKISYGLYLYHHMVLALMHGLLLQAQPSVLTTKSLMITLASIVATFLLATVSFYTVELAAQRVGYRLNFLASEQSTTG